MLVTVIIPIFNAASYLRGCVQSVLAQTHKAIEIIIVDNNSSDDSKLIAEDLQKAFPVMIRVVKEKKQGSNAARNSGLKVAKGEWIQFLDVDDRLFPSKIASQLEITRDADLIISPYYERLVTGKLIKSKIDQNPYLGLALGQFGTTSSLLFRKEGFREGYVWDEQLGNHQEYELMFRWIRSGAKYAIHKRPETFVIERDRDSITIMEREKFPLVGIQLIKEIEVFVTHNYPEQGAEYREKTNSHLFYLIRRLYKTNKVKALKYYKAIEDKNGIMRKQHYMYRISFHILGFKISERLVTLYKKIVR